MKKVRKSEIRPDFLLGQDPQGILNQESEGQKSFTESDTLPTKMSSVDKRVLELEGAVPLTTPDGVKDFMSKSTSEADWNSRCDEVKRVNAGYPDFWFKTIVLSGVAATVKSKW